MKEIKFEALNAKKFKRLKRNEMKLISGASGSRSYWCVNSFHDGHTESFIRGISDDGVHEGYSSSVRNDPHSYGSSASGYVVG